MNFFYLKPLLLQMVLISAMQMVNTIFVDPHLHGSQFEALDELKALPTNNKMANSL